MLNGYSVSVWDDKGKFWKWWRCLHNNVNAVDAAEECTLRMIELLWIFNINLKEQKQKQKKPNAIPLPTPPLLRGEKKKLLFFLFQKSCSCPSGFSYLQPHIRRVGNSCQLCVQHTPLSQPTSPAPGTWVTARASGPASALPPLGLFSMEEPEGSAHT